MSCNLSKNMDSTLNLEFRDLNEQLRSWNSAIIRMNQSIESNGDFIRALPVINVLKESADDTVKDDSVRLLDKLPYLDFENTQKPLKIRFFVENKDETVVLDQYKLSLLSNGWTSSKSSAIKFDRNQKIVGFSGNSYFFCIDPVLRAVICSWYCPSKSAPNFVVDFGWNDKYVALSMEDNFIRIISMSTNIVEYEFPSIIDQPNLIRISDDSEHLFVCNNVGEVAIQKLHPPFKIVMKFQLDFTPSDAFFSEDNVVINDGKSEYKINLNAKTIDLAGRVKKKSSLKVYVSDGRLFLEENKQSCEIHTNGIPVSCASIQKQQNPLIVASTVEGGIYIWQLMEIPSMDN